MGRFMTIPESDGEEIVDGVPPIVGHAVVVNGLLSVCEARYAVHQTRISECVEETKVGSLKWLVGGIFAPSRRLHIFDRPLQRSQLSSTVLRQWGYSNRQV